MALKSFRSFLKELSLARVWQHANDVERPSGVISAFTQHATLKDNMERTTQLGREIQAAGYGFSLVDGHYAYADGVPVEERSIFVVGNPKDSGRLKGLLKQWLVKYEQEAAILKLEGETNAYLLTPTGESKLGEFHANRMREFYSTMRHRSGSFVFESAFTPKNWLERLAESKASQST